MDIGLTVVAEATRWAENDALDPGAHGALQRVRDYMTDRLIEHKHEEVSPDTVRIWAHHVLNALMGQNTSN